MVLPENRDAAPGLNSLNFSGPAPGIAALRKVEEIREEQTVCRLIFVTSINPADLYGRNILAKSVDQVSVRILEMRVVAIWAEKHDACSLRVEVIDKGVNSVSRIRHELVRSWLKGTDEVPTFTTR